MLYQTEFNEENQGLVVRDYTGKVIDLVPFSETNNKYGCLSWDDIRTVLEEFSSCLNIK